MHAEPGSFRDRDNQVLYDDRGGVLRALKGDGLEDWAALSASRLFAEFSAGGQLVATRAEGAALLRHERIPFISYPYEWPFSMLKAAALLELDLLLAGLDEGLILKDGSPYNVQWRGSQPVFIDVGSFERLRSGEPWAGYRQFCMLFLYPLLLQAYRGVEFQPWLRGSLDGIEPAACRKLFSTRDLFRRGVFSHVVLHEKLERRHGSRGGNVRRELRAAGFSDELIKAHVRKLRKLVGRLRPPREDSEWLGYGVANSYSDEQARRKADVVEATARRFRPSLVWDLGCNDGRYARVAAAHSAYTVAMDFDATTVDALYQALVAEEARSILPLVVDLADPSPALGWRNLERKPLVDRGRPELTLCLALVHHLAITRNIPLGSFLEWLSTLDSAVLIEFPSESDPMVRVLLDAKRDGSHEDYNRAVFERLLGKFFVVDETVVLSSTRTMYRARPRR